MKQKLLAMAALVVTAFTAQAQDGGPAYKPTSGNITTEVLFNNFGSINLNSGLIRGRYFLSDASALRLSAGINYDYDKISDEAHARVIGITLAPGIEKHFAGTERLSPYIGAELPISLQSARYEDDNVEIEGSTSSNQYAGNRSFVAVGLNAVAGTDFYVARNFYLGFEVGLGLRYQKNGDVEINRNIGSDETIEGTHGINFSPFVNGGLRIGFVF